MTGQEARDDEREALIAALFYDDRGQKVFKYADPRILLGVDDFLPDLIPAILKWADGRYRKHPEAEAEYVRGGVCLLCGDGVMDGATFEHIDPERHVEEVDRITSGRKDPEPEITEYRNVLSDGEEIISFHRSRFSVEKRRAAGPWVPVGEGEQ